MILQCRRSFLFLLLALIPCSLCAQVSNDQLLHASSEPQNWLTYSGGYMSQRYSSLQQVTLANVKNLELKWAFQAPSLQKFEATPLVVNGIMYVTTAPNDIVALDAKTGRAFWVYHYSPSPASRPCCGQVNRGVAILGNTLFMATVDAHLVAIDAINGNQLWNVKVAEANAGYAMTVAPLVIKDKVITGVAGGELGIRGFIVAYDAKTGKEAWRFYTIPGLGEPGNDSWGPGDAWKHGGAPIWTTGSYDPELNLTYWGTGNPGPDYNAAVRPGDNLYSASVVALDADTGNLKWYFQFSPNDAHDYDATQVPVLADTNWNGSPRKLMFWANRNGFFYVLDRTTGKFLLGSPFAKITWASGLDQETGRPILTPQPPGTPVFPGPEGATNWYSPSYSPHTGLFYIPAWEDFSAIFTKGPADYKVGQHFGGGAISSSNPDAPSPNLSRQGPINVYTDAAGHGAVVALDPHDGKLKWTFNMYDLNMSGILTTASDVLFVGGREGYFQALNAKSGALLWKAALGGEIANGPMTYEADGKQYVVIASGNSLYAFGLRE
jgi:alcohol dehydrogenase (cytochrome c)